MTAARVQQIEERLRQELAPDVLQVVDESHLHAGHPGARDGKGHFRVSIVSDRFEGLTALARHRLVFSVLEELMRTDIHALSIKATTRAESPPR